MTAHNRKRTFILAILAMSACFRADQVTATESMKGTLKQVVGTVEIRGRAESDWRKAEEGMKIYPGDRISAGMQGRAILEFENSTTEILSMTQMAVGRTAEDDQNYATELFLQVGKIASEVHSTGGKQNRFTITTAAAVCGIRGSRIEVGHFPMNGTEMKITEGQGFVGAVRLDQLPPPVQSLLAPQAAPEAADDGANFDQWIAAGEQALISRAGEDGVPSFGFFSNAKEGQSVSVRDASDPASIIDVSQSLIGQAVPDVTSSAISEREREATRVTAEPVDLPVTIILRAEQTAQADGIRTAVTQTSTPSIRFPDRPGQ